MNDIGLKRRRFSLYELYQELVSESHDFNNIKTYQYSDTSDGWKFGGKLGGEYVPIYVYVEETRIGRFVVLPSITGIETVFNFGFEVSNNKISSQYTKTEVSYYLRILATVGEILNQFIDSVKPDAITLFSESKHGGTTVDIQKDNIYFAALDRNTPSGYAIESITDSVDGKHGLMLYRRA